MIMYREKFHKSNIDRTHYRAADKPEVVVKLELPTYIVPIAEISDEGIAYYDKAGNKAPSVEIADNDLKFYEDDKLVATGTLIPPSDASLLEARAQKAYLIHTEEHPAGNAFFTWSELSESAKQTWRDKT